MEASDAEKVREALSYLPERLQPIYSGGALRALDSILAELEDRQAAYRGATLRVAAAEERAEKAEDEAAKWQAHQGRTKAIKNDYRARIQELEAENDRLRQGLVEALEGQP